MLKHPKLNILLSDETDIPISSLYYSMFSKLLEDKDLAGKVVLNVGSFYGTIDKLLFEKGVAAVYTVEPYPKHVLAIEESFSGKNKSPLQGHYVDQTSLWDIVEANNELADKRMRWMGVPNYNSALATSMFNWETVLDPFKTTTKLMREVINDVKNEFGRVDFIIIDFMGCSIELSMLFNHIDNIDYLDGIPIVAKTYPEITKRGIRARPSMKELIRGLESFKIFGLKYKFVGNDLEVYYA